jgi:hypothetical protein
MTTVINKGQIGEQDIYRFDGSGTNTFTRDTSTGATLTLNKFGYEVNALTAYGGGVLLTNATVTACLTAIGTTTKATVFLAPGTWTFSTNIDYSAYTNITFKLPPGALISHGSYTLNIPNIEAGLYQIFTGAGAVTISGSTKTTYPEWFGTNTTPGTTDMTSALQGAITALSAGGVVKLSTTTYAFTTVAIATANITLEGDGWGSILRSTVAVDTDTPTNIFVQANNVTLRRFKVDHKNVPDQLIISALYANAYGDNVIGVGWGVETSGYYKNIMIDEVYIAGSKCHGISLGIGENMTVQNCRIDAPVWGTAIIGVNIHEVTLKNNKIYGKVGTAYNGDDSIYLGSSGVGANYPDLENVVITGNQIYNSSSKAIGVQGANGVNVSDNVIDGTANSGIYIRSDYHLSEYYAASHVGVDPEDVIVSNNVIRRPFENYGAGERHTTDAVTEGTGYVSAINVIADHNAIVTGNSIYGTDTSLIDLDYRGIEVSAKNVVLSNNSIYGLMSTAFRVGIDVTSRIISFDTGTNAPDLYVAPGTTYYGETSGAVVVSVGYIATGAWDGSATGVFCYNITSGELVTGEHLHAAAGGTGNLILVTTSSPSVPYPVNSLTMAGNNLMRVTDSGWDAIVLYGVGSGLITGNYLDCANTAADPEGRFIIASYSTNVHVTNNYVVNCSGAIYTDNIGSSGFVYTNNKGLPEYPLQTPTDKADTAPTLTITEILGGIISGTPTAGRNYELPTGTLSDASNRFAAYGYFDWSLINLASATHAITLTVGVDHTIVGSPTVSAASTARFRTQKTAANTFITYRIG